MELFFRKYFWVVNLLFLLAAAFLGAKTVNAFIGGMLAPVPDFAGVTSGPPAIATPQIEKTTLSPEALSRVTGIALPEPEPVVEETPSDQVPIDGQEAVRSGLRVKLVGTLVANRPEWSLATVEDVSTHEVNVYMVGDKVQNAEVLEIERLRMIINNQGRKEFVDLEAGDGSAPIAAVTPPHGASAPPPPPGAGSGIRAVSDDTYEVPKEEINKALGDLNNIAMQARIVPAFKDGVATGFKLFSIRPDSLYTKIGIQNGDVVRRINGFEMNSPDKALEIYSKLRESSRIEIELERNGSPMRKTYNVR